METSSGQLVQNDDSSKAQDPDHEGGGGFELPLPVDILSIKSFFFNLTVFDIDFILIFIGRSTGNETEIFCSVSC